jgi:hypothetical protein
MLECIEPEKGYASDVLVRGINPKDAAGLMEAFQTPTPSVVSFA